jgi:DnaJ family protein C protein 3
MTELVCRAYSELKLPDKTIKWCDTHLQHAPESFEALLARGDAYLIKERVDEALRDFKKASEINGNDRRVNERLHRTQRLQKMASKRDYYKILGVSKDATERDIKKAYRKLAKEWHPDTYRGDLSSEQVLARMSEINLAHEVLMDQDKRRQYDEAGVDPNDPNGGQGGGQPFYGSPFGAGGGFHFEGFGGGSPFEFHF